MSTDLQKVANGLLALPPDESLREAEALVDRFTKTDIHWRVDGLPDALAEIQEATNQLWVIQQQQGGRYNRVLSALKTIPPMLRPSLPPGF